MQRGWLLVVLVLQAIVVARGDVRHHLGTKTPYWTDYVQGSNIESWKSSRALKDTPVPAGCSSEPVYFNYLARHGSREPTSGDVRKLLELQKTIASHANEITNPTFAWMKNWTSPYEEIRAGYLDVFGEEEHYNISKRFVQRFPSLFHHTYFPNLYPIRTTQVTRTAVSGNAFGFGMMEDQEGTLGPYHYEPFFTYSASPEKDIELRFFDNCPAYSREVIANSSSFYQSERYLNAHIDELIAKVKTRLGNWSLEVSDVKRLYLGCAFEVAVYNVTDRFCTLFDDDDLAVLEYASDLEDYYVKGYGNKISYEISCPLLSNFFHVMNEVISGKKIQHATLRFAHAETLLPFIALLGLYKDNQPLTWDMTPQQIQNRKWKTSGASPFAGNVAFLLYNCSTSTNASYRLKLLHNEVEKTFPGCSELYCPYETVWSIYSNAVSQCDFDRICDVTKCTNTTVPADCSQCFKDDSGEVTRATAVFISISAFVAGIFVGLLLMIILKRCSERGTQHYTTLTDMHTETDLEEDE